MNERNELPQILQNLSKQMGREPEPTVTNLQDYAPKAKEPAGAAIMKSQHILDGLHEIAAELQLILNALRGDDQTESPRFPHNAALLDKLDAQARYLASAHGLIADIKNIIL